jgi:predicted nucleic acid-binding protein
VAAVLIDTNVLVYAHDSADPAKQERAIETLDGLQATSRGVLSVQVLAEFYVVATRGSRPLLLAGDAARQAARLAAAFPVLDLTPLVVLEAMRGVRERSLSYWDAQLWATARLNQIPVIFSEDFDVCALAGATIEGVHFVSPFVEDFCLDDWLA